jgi:hypothetical protein
MEYSEATYHTLHGADEHAVQNLARLVAVADIFKGFGAVLAADVEKDFLATTIERCISLLVRGNLSSWSVGLLLDQCDGGKNEIWAAQVWFAFFSLLLSRALFAIGVWVG